MSGKFARSSDAHSLRTVRVDDNDVKGRDRDEMNSLPFSSREMERPLYLEGEYSVHSLTTFAISPLDIVRAA